MPSSNRRGRSRRRAIPRSEQGAAYLNWRDKKYFLRPAVWERAAVRCLALAEAREKGGSFGRPRNGDDRSVARAARAGGVACDARRDVRLGFFREPGQRRVHAGGVQGSHRLLREERALTRRLEEPHLRD